jgi:hypothetical protein
VVIKGLLIVVQLQPLRRRNKPNKTDDRAAMIVFDDIEY